MTPLGTAFFAGLCLLASCVRAQPVIRASPPNCPALSNSQRSQYCVTFKIVAGKLAAAQDAFRLAPSFVRFEPAIRSMVQQAIAKIPRPYLAALGPAESDLRLTDSLTQNLRRDSTWQRYIGEFQSWAAANPDRLDLGTLFSAGFLFAETLKQTPDFGLILNEDEVDASSGTVSFSILPPFDAKTIKIGLPAMTESRRRARLPQLRKRLARLNGSLWSSPDIRQALGPLYTNLGLTPQLLVLPRNQTIQIVEGPRIASIVLPADRLPAGDLDRVLWDLLDTGHFRMAMRAKNIWAPNRMVDFNRDLGYLEGDEPYAIQYQLQAMQLLISQLGYTLGTRPSSRTGLSQYVDLIVQPTSTGGARKRSRHIAGGFEYKPGQGFSALGNAQLSQLAFPLQPSAVSVSGGGTSGELGILDYSSDFLGFERLHQRVSLSLEASTSIERSRFLDGVRVDQRSTSSLAAFEWQHWRGLDGSSIAVRLDPSYALVLNRNMATLETGAQFVRNNLASEYPWRLIVEPRVLIGVRFADWILTANTHRSFDEWEYDLSGRLENAVGDAPLFELPSLGGAGTVRGFRADDAIGRRLWSTQSELWHAVPGLHLVKIATFFDLGGAYRTSGSHPGLRAGPGTGLRLDLRVAVLRFDWAYGLGQAATGGSRGKFYFSIALNTPR